MCGTQRILKGLVVDHLLHLALFLERLIACCLNKKKVSDFKGKFVESFECIKLESIMLKIFVTNASSISTASRSADT